MNDDNEVVDESLKRLIKRKAIKSGFRGVDKCFIRYYGRLYSVNFKEDKVVLQSEFK